MIKELKIMYNIFPRKMFTTHSWEISSFQELIDTVNKNISFSRVSTSIYNYSNDVNNIVVDKVVFDLDSSSSHSEAIRLHEYLLDKNIRHFIVFSGANFHIYSKILGTPVFKRDCIKNISLKVEKELEFENDESVRGNLNHNLSIPYTFNFKRMRYVRFLTSKELYLQYPEICDLAKKQEGKLEIYGTDGFHTADFDYSSNNEDSFFEVVEGETSIEINENILKDLPERCKEYMSCRELDHYRRLRLITWLAEFGLSKEQTIEVLRRSFSPKKFRHCVFEERQVDAVYLKKRLI